MNFDPKKDLPKRGPTGSLVVDVSLSVESGDEVAYRLFEPQPPRREVAVYDDDDEWDGYCGTRVLSDDEYAEAYLDYERAKAEWARGGGAGFVGLHGMSDVIEVTIKCQDDSTARGYWDGKTWKWVETITWTNRWGKRWGKKGSAR